ncbi:MAG: cation:proton antiporter [Steroidobacteraceae bacterium]
MTQQLSQLGLLLFVSALVAMPTRRLHLPYTVGLVFAGMGLYFLDIYIQWHVSRDLIFSVFLPPLVFEAALFISWRELKRDFPVVALLATVGVGLAAAVVAIGMHYALSWDWGSAILFGVLIASVSGKWLRTRIAVTVLQRQPGESSLIGWPLQSKALIAIIFSNVLFDKGIITGAMFTALLLVTLASTMLAVPTAKPKFRRRRVDNSPTMRCPVSPPLSHTVLLQRHHRDGTPTPSHTMSTSSSA